MGILVMSWSKYRYNRKILNGVFVCNNERFHTLPILLQSYWEATIMPWLGDIRPETNPDLVSHVCALDLLFDMETTRSLHRDSDFCVYVQEKEKVAMKQSEDMAEQGNVDESMEFANQAEQFRKQYAELYKLAITPERTMQVCDVCGVFINASDSEQRKAVSFIHDSATITFLDYGMYQLDLTLTSCFSALPETVVFDPIARMRLSCMFVTVWHLICLHICQENWLQLN